jgi:hypothetical protein
MKINITISLILVLYFKCIPKIDDTDSTSWKKSTEFTFWLTIHYNSSLKTI